MRAANSPKPDAPPGCWRPTTLKLAGRHCPRAATLYLEGAKRDRRIFAAGSVAHAVFEGAASLQNAAGERALGRAELERMAHRVAEAMIREGRSFEGIPEDGPLPADVVWRGVNRALDDLEREPLTPGLNYKAEQGLAVGSGWNPMPYSTRARLRLIVDLAFSFEEIDDESAATVLVHRDYKGAPSTDETELDTVQLKAQTLVLLAHHGVEGIDAVRQEVVNVFFGRTFSRTIWLDLDGEELLRRWRREIEVTMAALDAGRDEQGRYKASPGGNCFGCPYVAVCPDALSWASEARPEDPTPEDRARRFAVLKAACEELGGRDGILRDDTREAPISLGDGSVVGTVEKEGVAPVADVGALIWEEWERGGGQVGGLLYALHLGIGNLRAVAKVLYEDPVEREAWLEGLTQQKWSRLFGLHKELA